MASLYKRGKVWYSKIKIRGKRVRKPLSTNYKIAEEELGKLIKQRNAAKHGHVNRDEPWKEFRVKYLISRKNDMDPRTYDHDRLALELLEDYRPIDKIMDVSPTTLVDLKNHWVKINRSPSAINRSLRSIKLAMRTAENWYKLDSQKWDSIGRVKENKGKTRWFNEEELNSIYEQCHGQWMTIGLLAFEAGMRRGEILNLTWARVLFDRNAISIGKNEDWDPKSEEGNRLVPIKPGLKKYLQKLHAKSKSPYVLEDRITLGTMTTYFKRIIRKAKLAGSLHTMRHSFGAHLAQAGKPLAWIAKVMGHSNERITELYGHLQALSPESLLEPLPDFASKVGTKMGTSNKHHRR
jgi:integrase